MDNFRLRLEALGFDSEQIDEVLPLLGASNEEGSVNPTLLAPQTAIEQIRLQMVDEPDWKKRAAMAARIISLGFD